MRPRIPRTAIPNTVTALCLLCGYLSIVNTLQGAYLHAAYFSLYAGFLDVADGSLAKMLRATSATGSVFDSLSDLLTFGAAPAILADRLYFTGWGTAGMLIGGVFVLAAAVRLARYTARQASDTSGYFAGLPMPLSMGLLSGFVPFSQVLDLHAGAAPVAATLTLVAACLMVSNVPYERSLQFAARRVPRSWKRNAFVLFLLTVLVEPNVSFFSWALLLTGGGLVREILLMQRRRARRVDR